MKSWATESQLAWLKQQLPQWAKAHSEKKVRPFLDGAVVQFFAEFSIPDSERAQCDAVSLFL